MARRVFLSFVQEDLELVRTFRGQAKNQNNDLEFSDFSAQEPFNSSNAAYIQRQITELIIRTSVTICLIGYTTNSSPWINWELDKAEELEKWIVGVKPHSSF